MLSVEFGDMPTLILRLQRELFVAAAELATNPDAWDRLEDGRTRVSAEMVASSTGCFATSRATSRCPASSSSRARRRQRRARAGSDDPPSGGAAGGCVGTRGVDPGTAFATVSEPARRPALGPREGRRAGGVPVRHPVTTRSPASHPRRRHHEGVERCSRRVSHRSWASAGAGAREPLPDPVVRLDVRGGPDHGRRRGPDPG